MDSDGELFIKFCFNVFSLKLNDINSNKIIDLFQELIYDPQQM